MSVRAITTKIQKPRTASINGMRRDAANRFASRDYNTCSMRYPRQQQRTVGVASKNLRLKSGISATPPTQQRAVFSSKTDPPSEKDKNLASTKDHQQLSPPPMDDDESHLNWKDRKEAPKWMRRIAPGKGGKWPPSPQEAVILAAGISVFVWSCVA